MIDTVITCPLGHTCEEVKDGKIHRCAWYIQMAGTDQNNQLVNENRCAIAWQPILMVEMSSTNRGQTQAIESLRNETVRRQDAALAAMGNMNEKAINNQRG